MDNEKPNRFSPLISKNTPIKRLGLSRKRKSPDVGNQANKIHVKNISDSPLSTNVTTKHIEVENTETIHGNKTEACKNTEESSPKIICNDDSLESLKERIEEKENKLKLLKQSGSNSQIAELENLYDIWKNGCKKGLIHLISQVKDQQPEFNNVEKISEKLGIWDVVQDAFQEDLDFLAYED